MREIISHLSADAGDQLAVALRSFTISDFCTEVIRWFTLPILYRILLRSDIKGFSIRMPYRTLKRIVRGLIKNALDASEETDNVTLTCRKDDEFLYFEVHDKGQGMDNETLAKAIEPFFTTKDPGRGLGLGLFLTKSAAERFGGTLHLESSPGKGTTATISFAHDQIS